MEVGRNSAAMHTSGFGRAGPSPASALCRAAASSCATGAHQRRPCAAHRRYPAILVLDIGRRDPDRQPPPVDVDGNVALAAKDFFARIISPPCGTSHLTNWASMMASGAVALAGRGSSRKSVQAERRAAWH